MYKLKRKSNKSKTQITTNEITCIIIIVVIVVGIKKN